MFTNLEIKMAFGLSVTGSIAATTESNLLGNLSLKVKQLLTLTSHVKPFFITRR